MRVVLAMAWKELLIALRDKKTGFIILFAPLIQLILFGFVVTTEIKELPVGFIDLDDSPLSRRIIERLDPQEAFDVKRRFFSFEEAEGAIKAGKTRLVVVVPSGFEGSIGRDSLSIQFMLDGSDANATRLLLSYLWPTLGHEIQEERKRYLPLMAFERRFKEATSTDFGKLRAISESGEGWSSSLPKISRIKISTRVFFNPNLKSPIYMVPGVIVLIITIISSVLTGVAVVREREKGTLEQILVSPMRPWEFILGKTVPFSLLALFDASLIFPLGVLIFHIPVAGNLFVILVGTLLFLMSTLGLGLLSSTISETQQQAMMTAFFVLMPMYLLSGLFFPVKSMPPFFQWIAFINPLTHFLLIVRGVLLKGATFADLGVSFIFLLIFGALIISVAILRFGKRIK